MTKKVQEVNPHDAGTAGQAGAPAVYMGPTGIASNVGTQNLRLPRITLLQSKSPQVENNGETYRAGMFIDSLTQDIISQPINFVPCFIFTNVIKWKPRSEGGGMAWKTLNPTAEQLAETQFKGDVKPTADLYINAVCMVEGNETPMMLSFCKTSLKTGQDLVTLATLSGCAWKYKYTLSAEKVSKAAGTFYVMKIKRGALNDDPSSALEMYKQVQGLSIETDYEGATHETSPDSGEPKEF